MFGPLASAAAVLAGAWYSLTDQVDWHIGLREARGIVDPRRLFDLARRVRPPGRHTGNRSRPGTGRAGAVQR